MITSAHIMPHAPILLANIGTAQDRQKAKKTIEAMEKIGLELKTQKFDEIIISSPHKDWGFNVPLRFAAPLFRGKIHKILTGFESPKEHFEKGQGFVKFLDADKKYVLIASGDLSHRLKEEGPYGFHEQGPKFDKKLIENLKKSNFEGLLNLEAKYPEAGDCGLRSFCFTLGLLKATNTKITPAILSYESPFGIGYLVGRLA